MKYTKARIITALIFIFASTASVWAQTTDEFLITGDAVGRVKLGMTFGEARKIWPDYTFLRVQDFSGAAPVAVLDGNKILFVINTDQKEYSYQKLPLDDDAKIYSIGVLDERYRTTEGVHPQMTVRKVEQIYGDLRLIVRNSIGLNEEATFTEQPPVKFRIANGREYAGLQYRRPDKQKGTVNFETTQFAPTAYIERITISDAP